MKIIGEKKQNHCSPQCKKTNNGSRLFIFIIAVIACMVLISNFISNDKTVTKKVAQNKQELADQLAAQIRARELKLPQKFQKYINKDGVSTDYYCDKKNNCPNLTLQAKKLKVGMSKKAVIKLLGKPKWVFLPLDKDWVTKDLDNGYFYCANCGKLSYTLLWKNTNNCDPIAIDFNDKSKLMSIWSGNMCYTHKSDYEPSLPSDNYKCTNKIRRYYCDVKTNDIVKKELSYKLGLSYLQIIEDLSDKIIMNEPYINNKNQTDYIGTIPEYFGTLEIIGDKRNVSKISMHLKIPTDQTKIILKSFLFVTFLKNVFSEHATKVLAWVIYVVEKKPSLPKRKYAVKIFGNKAFIIKMMSSDSFSFVIKPNIIKTNGNMSQILLFG